MESLGMRGKPWLTDEERHLRQFVEEGKSFSDISRFGSFEKIRVDYTREGPSVIADMENSGIENAEGVNFSVPRKSEMASLLKQRMSNNKFFYPLLNWERPYRGNICTELNIERYDLRKDGTIDTRTPTAHTTMSSGA